jgi:hypothetical protein
MFNDLAALRQIPEGFTANMCPGFNIDSCLHRHKIPHLPDFILAGFPLNETA